MPAAWVITFERSLFHCLEFVSLLRDSKVSLLGVLCCYSRLLLAEFVLCFRFSSRSDSFLDDWHVKLVRFAWAQAAICISCRHIISSCLMLWFLQDLCWVCLACRTIQRGLVCSRECWAWGGVSERLRRDQSQPSSFKLIISFTYSDVSGFGRGAAAIAQPAGLLPRLGATDGPFVLQLLFYKSREN